MRAKNIWLLTEERPKAEVVEAILKRFCTELNVSAEFSNPKVLPIMKDGKFTFCYRLVNFECSIIKEVFILPVSGYSSFVDFMLFHQDDKPSNKKDKPLFLIEETKTDDKESRNTGVYQRCSKFVFTEFFYPDTKKIMLYNLKVVEKERPTLTYIFGTKMLSTLGVEIIGKKPNPDTLEPFRNIDEMIGLKNAMPAPHYGVPVRFKQSKDTIFISAKLEKNGRLQHDPNIGMTAIMSACLRELGWKGRIVITEHGLPGQSAIGHKTKFNYIAHQHQIELDGLKLPGLELPEQYWQEETSKEKTGTIFTHVICENLADGVLVYENHGGCERGYFYDYFAQDEEPITIPKYTNREKYKGGDKTSIIYIPDLVIYDKGENEVINIEGKTFANRSKGVEELHNYDYFEDNYVKPHYKGANIKRSLVLSGEGDINNALQIKELNLYLDTDGVITLGQSAPSIVKRAVKQLSSL